MKNVVIERRFHCLKESLSQFVARPSLPDVGCRRGNRARSILLYNFKTELHGHGKML